MRVFLGLQPPELVRDALAMQQFLLPLPRRIAVDDLHLTLVFCDEVPDPQLESLHEAFAGIRAAPFDLMQAGLGLFGGAKPHSAWAGLAPSQPLEDLQSRAAAAARLAGLDLPHRRFVPHVTLGRFGRLDPAGLMRLERGIAAGAGFSAGPWRVDEMVLWHSDLTRSGARYSELARYAFADAGGRPGAVS